MNIDDLILNWAHAERKIIEFGGGFPKQTSLAAYADCSGRSGFDSSIPIGFNKEITKQHINIRSIITKLPTELKDSIRAKYVFNLPIRLIAEHLQSNKAEVYAYIKVEKREISRELLILKTN